MAVGVLAGVAVSVGVRAPSVTVAVGDFIVGVMVGVGGFGVDVSATVELGSGVAEGVGMAIESPSPQPARQSASAAEATNATTFIDDSPFDPAKTYHAHDDRGQVALPTVSFACSNQSKPQPRRFSRAYEPA